MTTTELKKLAEAANLTIYQRASMTSDEFFEAEQLRSRYRKESPAAILKLLAINAGLVEAFKLIAETDPVDAALDPQRAVRVSRAALAKYEGVQIE